jgi:hypothetical protein
LEGTCQSGDFLVKVKNWSSAVELFSKFSSMFLGMGVFSVILHQHRHHHLNKNYRHNYNQYRRSSYLAIIAQNIISACKISSFGIPNSL